MEFDLTTLVVIGTDCIGSSVVNTTQYHTMTTTASPMRQVHVDCGLATDDYGGLWMFIATVNNNSITLWRINLVMGKTRVDVSGNLPQIFYHTSCIVQFSSTTVVERTHNLSSDKLLLDNGYSHGLP